MDTTSAPQFPPLPEHLRRRLEPLRELLHAAGTNRVVPFVGSGLSRGLPSWSALLQELVSFLPEQERAEMLREIDAGKLLEVAAFVEESQEVGASWIHELIVRHYQTNTRRPEIYDAVTALPTVHFLTTNYDPWLKNAVAARIEAVPNVLLPTDRGVLGHLDAPTPWVFHLHGDAAKPESCVLTARAYRRLLSGQPAWRKAVEGLISSRHLLFLGTSLSEPHLDVLFGEFAEAFEGARRRHWWLGVPTSRLHTHRLEQHGIEVVNYEEHDLLPPILAWLATSPRTQAVSEPPQVTPVVPADYNPSRPWFFVPFEPKGAAMVGREAALARVRAQLAAGRPTAIGQTAAFTGIGGIGKTQLAVEYCWERREDYPGGVYWFTTDQDIDSQILRLVDEARWVHASTESSLKLQIARRRLRAVTDALFVFDNVEQQVGVGELRPEPGRSNHLLLTSRVEQPDFQRVEIELLSPEQGLELLLGESRRVTD